MIEYNKTELEKAARTNGFNRDVFEKALRVMNVLMYINSQNDLNEHLTLKGGTAINTIFFDLPRLSVDIDLDFTPNLSLDEMQDTRKDISAKLINYMKENGYQLSDSSRYSHSLASFLFQYQNAGGNRDNIKVEINYSLRAHIFEPVEKEAVTNAFSEHPRFQVLDLLEIFAAKANALLNRAAARDLYDFYNMISFGLITDSEQNVFRKCIVFYASLSSEKINKSFETSSVDRLSIAKIRRELFPVMREKDYFDLEQKKSQVKEYFLNLMKLLPEEEEYLERFESGEYKPELLFDDDKILANIKNHPMAIWKMGHR